MIKKKILKSNYIHALNAALNPSIAPRCLQVKVQTVWTTAGSDFLTGSQACPTPLYPPDWISLILPLGSMCEKVKEEQNNTNSWNTILSSFSGYNWLQRYISNYAENQVWKSTVSSLPDPVCDIHILYWITGIGHRVGELRNLSSIFGKDTSSL